MFQRINFNFLTLVSLCIALIIGAAGCGDDDDSEWIGTWTLETVDGESIQAQFEAIKLLLEAFGETETNISYTDTREQWKQEFRNELDALREPIERLDALLKLYPYKLSRSSTIRETFAELENEQKNEAFYRIDTDHLEKLYQL